MKPIQVGIIGGGLMGRETASAFGRWFALSDMPVRPVLTAVCDVQPSVLDWYRQLGTVRLFTADYRELLADPAIEVVYVAVPHHLHEEIYTAVLRAGKDLLAEKPFGIDLGAAERIMAVVAETGRFVRCSSEFPFLPGPQAVYDYVRAGRPGPLLEVKSGFHHASDMNPHKPLNWKRQVQYCGEIGVMGDLGMHALHLPFRLGLYPERVYAQLQNIVPERPDGRGGMAPCDTWDNALLHTTLTGQPHVVPMTIETKRIAPSETNTWYIEVLGMEGGVRYSTKTPKTLWTFELAGKSQRWQQEDLGFQGPFPTITGGIFEPGFPDCFQQMLAAYFAERAGALGDRFGCVRPEEALASHRLFAAALTSHRQQAVIPLPS